MVPRADGFALEPRQDNRVAMRDLHSRYHAEVCAKYGLERDSGLAEPRRRTPIDRVKGAVERAAAGGYSPDYLLTAPAPVQQAVVAAAAEQQGQLVELRGEVQTLTQQRDTAATRLTYLTQMLQQAAGGTGLNPGAVRCAVDRPGAPCRRADRAARTGATGGQPAATGRRAPFSARPGLIEGATTGPGRLPGMLQP